METFSATLSTAAMLSDSSPPTPIPYPQPPQLQQAPPSTPGRHSFHLIYGEKNTYLFEETEDLGISSNHLEHGNSGDA